MKTKWILTALILAGSIASCQSGKKADTQTQLTGNPIIEGWYADPEAIIYDDTYWIYPTSSNGAMKATYFDCFSSKDLVNWEKHACILDTATVSWASKALWAPAVLKKDNKYYFFFSANDIHQGDVGGIGVAVSDRPEGPYKDFNDNGNYYMYYGGWGHCNIVRLKDDFTQIIPFEDGTMYKEVTPEHYVEGPFVFKKNNKYYFMWSEGGWTGPDYSVAYAISDSPFGPFERIGKILEQDPNIGTGAGHHSVIQIPGTEEYYIVYHRHPLNDKEGTHRNVCIDRMTFDENGFINPVKLTMEGVEAKPLK